MTATFDFAKFAASAAQMDRDLIAQARALAAAHGDDLRAAIIAMPGHEGLANRPANDLYPYATGLMSNMLRMLADLAERELDRSADLFDASNA